MSQVVTLSVRLDKAQAVAGLRELNAQVKAAFTGIAEQVDAVNAQMRELTFDPKGILRGTDQAARGVAAVHQAVTDAVRSLRGLGAESETAGAGLKAVGAQATGADKKLATLAATSSTVGTALGDMGTAAGTADAALDGLDVGAATAGKSVAGMGRAAANTLPRLEALSKVAFNPAGVEDGANIATAALDRVKLAAAETRAALRSAGGGIPPVFLGGGRRGAAGDPEERRPLTFGEGVRSGAGAAVDLGGAMAAITTLAAAASGKLAADFDNTLQGVRGNTTMSPADAAAMRAQVLALMRTGTSPDELARGYMHVQNFGYKGQDAAHILTEANRFGVGTHTPVDETADVLAGVLNAYKHMPAEMASAVANTIHFAAAGSNMTIGELEKNSSRTVGLAANYGVGLDDALAAYSALVQHRLNPARADTQVAGMLGQIAAPSDKAAGEAKRLGLTDFNRAGLMKPDGLFNVINEVRRAIAPLPVNDQAAALKNLFNNKQGGIGATFLTGAAAPTYAKALNDPAAGTRAALAGKADAISPLYAEQMKQTQQAFKALSGEIKSDFIPVGEKLGPVFTAAIPVVRELAGGLKALLSGFAGLPRPAQEAILAIGGLKLISAFLPMLTGFSLVSERTGQVLRGLGGMLLGIGPAAAEGETGIAALGGVMGGPFLLGIGAVAAACAALFVAWKTDFWHIREVTASVMSSVSNVVGTQVANVRKWFTQNLPLIRETVATVLTTIKQLWHDHGARVMAIIGPLWDFIKQTVVNAVHLVENVVKLALDLINGNWSAAGADLLRIVGTLWSEICVLVVNGVKAVGNALALIVSVVNDLYGRLVQAGLNLGKAIVGGIVDGVKAGFGHVADAMTALGEHALTAAKAALDIHSPSRKMREVGQFAAEGYRLGLLDGMPGVAAAMSLLAASTLGHPAASGGGRWLAPSAGTAGQGHPSVPAYVVRGMDQIGRSGADLLNKCKVFVENGLRPGWQSRARSLPTNMAEFPMGTILHLAAGGREGTRHWGETVGPKFLENASNYRTGVATVTDRRSVDQIRDRIIGAFLPSPGDVLPLSAPGRYPGLYPPSRRSSAADRLTRSGDHAEDHKFDAEFDNQAAQDGHYAAKWHSGLSSNADFLKYVTGRKAALLDWGKAHQEWLNAHQAAAARFQDIEKRIDAAAQQVTGRMAKAREVAQAENDKIHASLAAMDDAGPSKFSRMLAANQDQFDKEKRIPGVDLKAATDLFSRNRASILGAQTDASNDAADKKVDWQARTGEMAAPDVLNYFTKRRDDLAAGGKAYTDEWYRISEYVIQLQNQIKEAERSANEAEAQSLRERSDALKNSFEGGKMSSDAYRAALAALNAEIATYTAAHPGSAPALETATDDIGRATAGLDVNGIRSQFSDIKSGLKSGDIDPDEAKGQLQPLLQAAPDKSALQSEIKAEIAKVSKDGGDFAPLMDGLRKSASDAGAGFVMALLQPRNGKNIYKQFWSSLADTGDSILSAMLKKVIAAAMVGIGGKGGLSSLFSGGGLGSLLGGLFADGGDPPVGVPSIVGERGPELFVPRVPGTIIPNHKLALAGGGATAPAGAGGGKSLTAIQHFHGPVTMGGDAGQSLDDLGRFVETLDRNSR